MKTLFCLALVVAIISGCKRTSQMKQMELVSDGKWSIGEAKDCTIDGTWNQAHCFPPTVNSPGSHPEFHNYLVSVELEKPLTFDADHWAYNVLCRLDSDTHATCVQAAALKD